MARKGNVGAIIILIFCMLKFYWLWELCPVWVQAPLQCVAMYYIVSWYIYFIPMFYNEALEGYQLNDYDAMELMLETLFVFGVPFLVTYLYYNTLNKVYASATDIFGVYHSYFCESPHEQ